MKVDDDSSVDRIPVTSKMASVRDATASFFLQGNARQFDYVLKLYPKVLAMKAEEKKKPEELIKLDEWCVRSPRNRKKKIRLRKVKISQ